MRAAVCALTGIAAAFVLHHRTGCVRIRAPDTMIIGTRNDVLPTCEAADVALDDTHPHRLLGLGFAVRAGQRGNEDGHRGLHG